MRAHFTELRFSEHEATHRQIHTHVRQLIASGKLAPGTKLPSSEELSALWKTHAPTIQAAFAPLVKEGLLIRRPRKGTFVRQRGEKLTCVGIYSTIVPGQKVTPYISQLRDEVEKLLQREGVETRFFVDAQPDGPGVLSLPGLVEAARQRAVQAVIFLQSSWPRLKWQTKLPVPTAFQSSAVLPNNVTLNMGRLAEDSLRILDRQGCRSVGLIHSVRPTASGAEQKHRVYDDLLDQFVAVAGELGMELRNEWMRLAETDLRDGEHEQFGYEQFHRLADLPRRPAGLLVFSDSEARGVMTALLERRVSVPQELRLMLARNRGIEFFVPVPVTFAEMDVRKVAAALLEQIHRQLRGEPCEPISISFDFVSNEGSQSTATHKKGNQL